MDTLSKILGLAMPRRCSLSCASQYFALFLIIYFSIGPCDSSRRSRHHTSKPRPAVYTNEFAVEVNGGLEEANKIAAKHGFVNLGQVKFSS